MMNIRGILVLFLVLVSLTSYAQNNNRIKVYYGFTDSKWIMEPLLGGAGFRNLNSYELGFTYLRRVGKKISIGTGINLLRADVVITYIDYDGSQKVINQDLELVSIPLYANYSFSKYLYANAGLMLDIQNSEGYYSPQSGIGYGFAIGGKYDIGHFHVYVEPNFKQHSLLPFDKERFHQKLTQLGVQVGVGYTF